MSDSIYTRTGGIVRKSGKAMLTLEIVAELNELAKRVEELEEDLKDMAEQRDDAEELWWEAVAKLAGSEENQNE